LFIGELLDMPLTLLLEIGRFFGVLAKSQEQ